MKTQNSSNDYLVIKFLLLVDLVQQKIEKDNPSLRGVEYDNDYFKTACDEEIEPQVKKFIKLLKEKKEEELRMLLHS